MNELVLKATDTTLGIVLNKKDNIFKFEGRSRPENAVDYYQKVFDWVKEYAKDPLEKTVIDFKLDYFNSSSAKVFIQLLERFEKIHKTAGEILIKWHYLKGDDDILEVGEDFSELVDIPFEYCEIKKTLSK